MIKIDDTNYDWYDEEYKVTESVEYVYGNFCNCKILTGTGAINNQCAAKHVTEVDEDGVCINCGYYAINSYPKQLVKDLKIIEKENLIRINAQKQKENL